jgi:hypothetical protein
VVDVHRVEPRQIAGASAHQRPDAGPGEGEAERAPLAASTTLGQELAHDAPGRAAERGAYRQLRSRAVRTSRRLATCGAGDQQTKITAPISAKIAAARRAPGRRASARRGMDVGALENCFRFLKRGRLPLGVDPSLRQRGTGLEPSHQRRKTLSRDARS